MNFSRKIWVVVPLFLGVSCSSLVFRHLDTIIVNRIDGYFKLDRRQKLDFYQLLAPELRWLKGEGFERAVGLLEGLSGRVVRGMVAADLDWIAAEIVVLRRVLGARLIPPLARFAAGLRPEQGRRAAERFDDDERDLRRELARPEDERERRRFAAFLDRFEDWFGKADAGQRRDWEARHRRIPDNRALSLRLRREGQGAFLAAVAAGRPAAFHEKLLREAFVDPESSRPGWYREAAERENVAWREFTLVVARGLTERQRATFARKCAQWVERLRGLQD